MAWPSRTLSSVDWEHAERGKTASLTLNLSMLQVSSLPLHFFFQIKFLTHLPLPSPITFFSLCCPALTSGTYVILAPGHRYGFYHQKWLLILSSFPTLFTSLCLTLFIPGSHLALDLSQDRVIIAGKMQHAGTPGWCSDVKRAGLGWARWQHSLCGAPSFTASSAFPEQIQRGPWLLHPEPEGLAL